VIQVNSIEIYEFCQKTLMNAIQEKKEPKYKKLLAHIKTYNGLCDIICNYVTAKNVLGNKDEMANLNNLDNIDKLIQYEGSHVLSINSVTRFFQLLICIVFKYYPESPLSYSEQKALNKVHSRKDCTKNALEKMKEGDYYKLCIIESKYGIPIGGHSMLIYKNAPDAFTLFSPNSGAVTYPNLDGILDDICYRCNEVEIALMDNKKFLVAHHTTLIEKIAEVDNKNKSSYWER
jgi:hypothetical protein